MGFFSNIFKKKKGGTFVGNLIRSGAKAATGGLLGNGDSLRQWEESQAIQEQTQAVQQSAQATANQIGSILGNALKPSVDSAMNSKPVTDAQNMVASAWIKKNWWKLATPLLLIIGLTVYLTKRSNGAKKGGKGIKVN